MQTVNETNWVVEKMPHMNATISFSLYITLLLTVCIISAVCVFSRVWRVSRVLRLTRSSTHGPGLKSENENKCGFGLPTGQTYSTGQSNTARCRMWTVREMTDHDVMTVLDIRTTWTHVCNYNKYRLTNGKFCNERYNVTTRFVMLEGA